MTWIGGERFQISHPDSSSRSAGRLCDGAAGEDNGVAKRNSYGKPWSVAKIMIACLLSSETETTDFDLSAYSHAHTHAQSQSTK